MLRVSEYNIYLPFKENADKRLLIQGARGSFDIVDSSIANLLTQAETESSYLGQLTSENIDILLQRGYITNMSKDEEFKLVSLICQNMSIKNKKNICLTFIPTHNCNFRCEYCFEQNLQKKGSEFLEAKMSIDMVDSIFAATTKLQEQNYSLREVHLFGGEPLLKENKDVINHICKKASQFDNIPIVCISNGYDLDAFIDIIKEHNFDFIQVTLDGIEEEHNKRRYLVDKQGTFQKIIDNIDMALEAGIYIILRSNINNKNVDEVRKLLELYKEKGWTKLENFQYYFRATYKCYEADVDILSNIDLMKSLSENLDENIDKFKLNGPYFGIYQQLKPMLENNSFGPIKPGYCGASLGTYVIDPFGDVYACYNIIEDDDYSIGKLDMQKSEFIFNQNHDKWKKRTAAKLVDCKECKYILFCGGGCIASAKLTSNGLDRGFCDEFQAVFDDVATELCEAYIE